MDRAAMHFAAITRAAADASPVVAPPTQASVTLADPTALRWPALTPARKPSLLSPNDLEHATALALTEGGDARIELGAGGVNQYGCAPRPDPALIALGSSTASVISGAGFDAASRLLARLDARPASHRAESDRLRRELLALSGAGEVFGTQAVLAASGTDIHLIALTLAAGGAADYAARNGAAGDAAPPVRALMAEPAETGSGVPAALGGRHFGAMTCRGARVAKGAAIADAATDPACIALRQPDGEPRPAADIDADFSAHAAAIVATGARCLLVLTDLSKSGLLAPSPACAARLAARFAGRLDVLVDACQYRLAPATLRGYLARGFMVAITGSKFLTGPAFSGALLLPATVAERARGARLDGLRGYSGRADWPGDWSAASPLDARPNTGLLLRWEAALAELRRFHAVPDAAIDGFLAAWGAAVADRIAHDPAFEALAVPAIDRGGLRIGTGRSGIAMSSSVDARIASSWDQRQTIFPFRVVAPDGQPLDAARMAQLYRRMAAGDAGGASRFQLGQPVPCGTRDGIALSALRICASARMVGDALRVPGGTARAIDHALRALDRLAALAAR